MQREGGLLPAGTVESLGQCNRPTPLPSTPKSNLTFYGIQKTNCTIGSVSRYFIAFLSGWSYSLFGAALKSFRCSRNKLVEFSGKETILLESKIQKQTAIGIFIIQIHLKNSNIFNKKPISSVCFKLSDKEYNKIPMIIAMQHIT